MELNNNIIEKDNNSFSKILNLENEYREKVGLPILDFKITKDNFEEFKKEYLELDEDILKEVQSFNDYVNAFWLRNIIKFLEERGVFFPSASWAIEMYEDFDEEDKQKTWLDDYYDHLFEIYSETRRNLKNIDAKSRIVKKLLRYIDASYSLNIDFEEEEE